MMYLLLLMSVSLMLQNLHPSVIKEVSKSRERFTSNNTYGTNFTLLFEYLYFSADFWRTKFDGEFRYRRRLEVCSQTAVVEQYQSQR